MPDRKAYGICSPAALHAAKKRKLHDRSCAGGLKKPPDGGFFMALLRLRLWAVQLLQSRHALFN